MKKLTAYEIFSFSGIDFPRKEAQINHFDAVIVLVNNADKIVINFVLINRQICVCMPDQFV